MWILGSLQYSVFCSFQLFFVLRIAWLRERVPEDIKLLSGQSQWQWPLYLCLLLPRVYLLIFVVVVCVCACTCLTFIKPMSHSCSGYCISFVCFRNISLLMFRYLQFYLYFVFYLFLRYQTSLRPMSHICSSPCISFVCFSHISLFALANVALCQPPGGWHCLH